MCVVCQNVPAVMTGLSGAGLVVRAAIRRSRAPRGGQACEQSIAPVPQAPATQFPSPAPVTSR